MWSTSTGQPEGKPVNGPVEAIFDATHLPIQLGGGIRDLDTIAMWLPRRASTA